MKEITIVEEINIEEIKISLSFDSKKTQITINSDYSNFITEICEIINISKEDSDSLNLYYYDADEDKINITNESDYEIFYSQAKDEIVKEFYLEIKKDSKLNMRLCLTNFKKYLETKGEEQYKDDDIKQENNEIKNEKNKIEDAEDEENKNTIFIQEEKNENIILEESNTNNNNDPNNNKNNINFIQENDINDENNNNNVKETFNCPCNRCKENPIINVLYYCPECDLHLCEKCAKIIDDHGHELLKVESNEEYNEAVEESFEPIYKEKSYNIVLNTDEDENNNNNIQNQQSGFSLSSLVPKFIKNYWNKNKNQNQQ